MTIRDYAQEALKDAARQHASNLLHATLAGNEEEARYFQRELNAVISAARLMREGWRPQQDSGVWLVASENSGGNYRVGPGGCDCKAGLANMPCKHQALIVALEEGREMSNLAAELGERIARTRAERVNGVPF